MNGAEQQPGEHAGGKPSGHNGMQLQGDVAATLQPEELAEDTQHGHIESRLQEHAAVERQPVQHMEMQDNVPVTAATVMEKMKIAEEKQDSALLQSAAKGNMPGENSQERAPDWEAAKNKESGSQVTPFGTPAIPGEAVQLTDSSPAPANGAQLGTEGPGAESAPANHAPVSGPVDSQAAQHSSGPGLAAPYEGAGAAAAIAVPALSNAKACEVGMGIQSMTTISAQASDAQIWTNSRCITLCMCCAVQEGADLAAPDEGTGAAAAVTAPALSNPQASGVGMASRALPQLLLKQVMSKQDPQVLHSNVACAALCRMVPTMQHRVRAQMLLRPSPCQLSATHRHPRWAWACRVPPQSVPQQVMHKSGPTGAAFLCGMCCAVQEGADFAAPYEGAGAAAAVTVPALSNSQASEVGKGM